MSSDLYRFEIVAHSTNLSDQLVIDWGSGARFLAKRIRVALGKADHEGTLALLREALRAKIHPARRGALLNRGGKAQSWEHEGIAQVIGLPWKAGKKPSPSDFDAMERGLGALDGQAMAALLSKRWLGHGGIIHETWVLHALLHELEPDTLPPPATARLSLRIESIHINAEMPLMRSYGVENLALRLLGFLELGGPIDSIVQGGKDIARPLAVPLSATLVDRKPRAGTIHLLLPKDVADRYKAGIRECSTAWP